MAPAVPPAELQFAQRLASHEKGVRDRAVRKLRRYISAKTQRATGGFTQEELLKIWNGLFYCLWVQDEPLLQEELAVTMSQLVHVVSNPEAQHLFVRTFWQTMNREWKGVGHLRLDKYRMLIRLTLRQSFEVLRRNGWEESRIQPLLDILTKEVLHPESQSPDGVRTHLITVYLEELSNVGGRELLADQNLKFIDPFCKTAAETTDRTLVQTITRAVFEAIAQQPPPALEASTQDQGAEVGGDPLSGAEPACKVSPAAAAAVAGKGSAQTSGAAEDREGGGGSEAPGQPLQFDYRALAKRLLEVTSRKNTPPFNRKRLSRLAKRFQDLSAGGVLPSGLAADSLTNGDAAGLRGKGQPDREKQAAPGIGDVGGNAPPDAQEEPSGGPPRRKRKRRRRKSLVPEQPVTGNGPSSPAQGKAQEPLQDGAEEPGPRPGGAQKRRLGEPSPERVKRKRLRKKGLRTVGGQPGPPEEAAPRSAPQIQGTLVPKRKQKLGVLPAVGTGPSAVQWPCPEGSPEVDSGARSPPPQGDGSARSPPLQGDGGARSPPLQGDGGTRSPPPHGDSARSPPPHGDSARSPPLQGDGGTRSPPPQGGKMKRKKGDAGTLSLHGLSCPRPASLAKRKRATATVGSWPRQQGSVLSLGGSGVLSPPRKKPLRTEKDFVRFSAPFLPKPLFCRKAKGSAASCAPRSPVQPCRTPSSTKKVTFGLNRNTTAEFRKTDKSILVSPTGPSRVAFDPKQRPLHGVLKSSPASAALTTRKLLLSTPQRRPRAMDFF